MGIDTRIWRPCLYCNDASRVAPVPIINFMTTVSNKRFQKYDVYIGRPSKWGNPFSHLPNTLAQYQVNSRDEAVSSYRDWIQNLIKEHPELLTAIKAELKDKVLGCWCKPASCHGDVLAELADS